MFLFFLENSSLTLHSIQIMSPTYTKDYVPIPNVHIVKHKSRLTDKRLNLYDINNKRFH